jgi:hypothetical protein
VGEAGVVVAALVALPVVAVGVVVLPVVALVVAAGVVVADVVAAGAVAVLATCCVCGLLAAPLAQLAMPFTTRTMSRTKTRNIRMKMGIQNPTKNTSKEE